MSNNLSPFAKRVYVLFSSGLDTLQISQKMSVELKRPVYEHEVANALGHAQDAANKKQIPWPWKRTVRAGVGEIFDNGSTKK